MGGVAGWQEYTKIRQGTQGTDIKTNYTRYYASDNSTGDKVYVVGESTVYPDATSQETTKIVTTYAYLWYAPSGDAPAMIKQRTTTLAAVPTTQNGTNTVSYIREYFDAHGNLTWRQDERGIVNKYEYDDRDQLVKVTADIGSVPTPPGWTVNSGSHFGYVTEYEYDDLGRRTLELGPSHDAIIPSGTPPIRTATYMVYVESPVSAQTLGSPPVGDQTRIGRGYVTGSPGSYTYYLVDPVTITFTDKVGRLLDRVVSKRSTGSGRLAEGDTFLRADWSRWSFMQYTAKGQLEYQRDYFLIPAQSPDHGLDGINDDPGTAGTNYYETFYGYDAQTNMLLRVKAPNGTITRTLYDKLSRPTSTYVGTNDVPTGGTWEDWTPGAAGTNLVQVSAAEYDHGDDGGMSNVTTATRYVDADTVRQTRFSYDFRNRRTAVDGEETLYQSFVYDNLDRVIQVNQKDSTDSGNLIGRSETFYDTRHRIYRTKRYAVVPTSGSVGNALTGNNTYDAAGNLIKAVAPGAGILTIYTTYDNLGRVIRTETGYDDSGATGGKVIGEATDTQYDEAGNATGIVASQLNAGSTHTSQSFRVSYRYQWFDGIGRLISSADYGAPGSAPTRPSTTPTSSDTVLVTTLGYNDAGEAYSTVDPMGYETRSFFDPLGRKTKVVEHYAGSGTPSSPNSDDNRTTQMTYTPDGQVASLTAVMASSGDNQVTTYTYGTTLTDSDIASNSLLRKVAYPDSTGDSDTVKMAYNRQGQVKQKIDQAGTTHEYLYDLLGRLRHDCVTAFGTGVDTHVRRLTTDYEVRGMPAGLTSAMTAIPNDALDGGGVINQVFLEYDEFGRPLSDVQQHVGRAERADFTTENLSYIYEDGTDNFARFTGMTTYNVPDPVYGFTLNYGAGIDNGLNRVTSVSDGSGLVASYVYLGLSRQVRRDSASGAFCIQSLDRFNRTEEMPWRLGDDILVNPVYGYDRNSNRLWRDDAVNTSFGELYAYDHLNRLTDMQRGQLNGAKTAISSGTLKFRQNWGLDPVGNWPSFKEDSNGDGTYDLVQSRTNNKVNEITDITETSGPTWVTPAYNAVGNTTTMPQTDDPTATYNAVYDAWNRLVRITKPHSPYPQKVAEYEYDARGYRIRRREYDASGSFQKSYDDYFSNRWQLLESRVTTSPTAIATQVAEQFIWGQSTGGYVDELILRDRDTDNNGTLDERIYALQDANYNVAAIVDNSADVVERYLYSPYGERIVLDDMYNVRSASLYDWQVGHQGLFHETSTRFVHNRMRHLHTSLGAFLQRDSLANSVWNNLYEYLLSKPLILLDPDGNIPIGAAPPGDEPCGPESMTLAAVKCRNLGGLKAVKCYFVQNIILPNGSVWRMQGLIIWCNGTGDCDADEYNILNRAVHPWCDLPRSCDGFHCPCSNKVVQDWVCPEIRRREFNGLMCLMARSARDGRCFKGGDKAHKDERHKVQEVAAECGNKRRACQC